MTLLLIALIVAGTPAPPPDANAARRGLVNSTSQTFGGQKTFVDGGIVTESLTITNASSDAGFDILTATKAAMTLYVDLDGGNNSSACTGGDGGVCLTVNGALAKLPRFINHDATVNVASGTYGAFTLSNFQIAGGVTLRITGSSFMNVTPVQGAGTGTVTSYTAGVFPNQASITDSAQTWPVKFSTNDVYSIRGTFLTVTAPDGGTQTRIITGVNGTTAEFLSSFTTAPAAGWTYALQEPSTIFTEAGGGNLCTISDVKGQVTLTNLKFLQTFASSLPSITVSASRGSSGLRLSTSFVHARDTTTNAAATVTLSAPDGVYAFANSTFAGGNNSVTISVAGSSSTFSLSSVYVGGQRALLSCTLPRSCTAFTSQFDSRNITVNQAVTVGQSSSFSSTWINCTSRAAAGAYFGGVTGVLAPTAGSAVGVFNLSIDGCGNGIIVQGGTVVASGGTLQLKNINAEGYLTPTGAGFGLSRGAFVDLSAATLSYSHVGFDAGVAYVVGGAEVSDATLAAMPDGGQYFQNFQGTIFRR